MPSITPTERILARYCRFIIDEFHINNFEAGAIASMFFLGYAVSQIPAGFFIAKRGTRGWYRCPFSASPPLPG
jgi:MFS family permease